MKRKNYLIIFVFLVLETILFSSLVLASVDNYFSYQMNFPPGESRSHFQTITYTGSSLNVTIPSGFTIVNYSSNGTLSGTNISWGNGTNKNINYTIKSPSNCTEGDIYYSNIYINSTYFDRFVFVCIPDDKIIDYKVEYGHGDANYLSNDEPYISNEPITLFNLVRVWNIGHYLSPDEPAQNARMECMFENYPVRTYGRLEVDHGDNYINGTFFWDLIESGYWFRIGVLSQDFTADKSVGDFYHVNCSNLTYQFNHEQVQAEFGDCSLEIRDEEPFCISAYHSTQSGKIIYEIYNNEKYSTSDLTISRIVNDGTETSTLPKLLPGERIGYLADNISNITIFFIPSWFKNSRNPVYYKQTITYENALNVTPILESIADQTIYYNQTLSLYANATDPNNDTLTYYDNTSLFDINPSSGLINFTANSSMIGNYSILIYVVDPCSNLDSGSFVLRIIDYNHPPNITSYSPNQTNITINETQSILFNITIDDYDNDTLTVKWYLNDNLVKEETNAWPYNLHNYSFTTSLTSSGVYNLTVNVSDSVAYDLQSWNITVIDIGAPPAPPPPSVGGGAGGAPVSREIILPVPLPPKEKPLPPPKEIPKIPGLNVDIIKIPEIMDLSNRCFNVSILVENNGTMLLEDVNLYINTEKAWKIEDNKIYIGNLSEKEKREITAEMCFDCKEIEYLDKNTTFINVYAESKKVNDSESWLIQLYIPFFFILTDRDKYFEGDKMEICMVFNNLNCGAREGLEFEVNINDEKKAYIIDFLSPYKAEENRVFINYKDYLLEYIPSTKEYIINVKLFEKGLFFSKEYLVAEANKTIYLVGLFGCRIVIKEGERYLFSFKEEKHILELAHVYDDYIELNLYSLNPINFNLSLFETKYIDTDKDGIKDLSFTFLEKDKDRVDIEVKQLKPEVPGIVHLIPGLKRFRSTPAEISFTQLQKIPENMTIEQFLAEPLEEVPLITPIERIRKGRAFLIVAILLVSLIVIVLLFIYLEKIKKKPKFKKSKFKRIKKRKNKINLKKLKKEKIK